MAKLLLIKEITYKTEAFLKNTTKNNKRVFKINWVLCCGEFIRTTYSYIRVS